jgi:hypothetical protein
VCRHTAFHLRQLVAGLWSSSLSLGLGHCWLTLGACPFCRAPHPPLTVGIGARPHVLGVQLGACPKSPGTRSLPSFSTVPRGPDETLDSCAVRASREDSFSLECLASDITVLTRPRRTLYLGEEEPPPRDALRPPPPGSLTPSTVFLQRGLRILQRSRTRFTTFLGRLGSSFHRRRWTRVRLESLPPDRSPGATADEAPFPSCFTPLEECHPHPAPSPSPPNRSSMFTDVATLVTFAGRCLWHRLVADGRRLQGLVPRVGPSLDPALPPGCRSPLLPWVSGSPSRLVARRPLAATRTRESLPIPPAVRSSRRLSGCRLPLTANGEEPPWGFRRQRTL